jgi:hypothetical protein
LTIGAQIKSKIELPAVNQITKLAMRYFNRTAIYSRALAHQPANLVRAHPQKKGARAVQFGRVSHIRKGHRTGLKLID